jgi:predicted adenylyl cyclase CyaB
LIETEECVRIRVSDKASELTWKPPTTEAMKSERQFWKRELNVPIGGDLSEWREMMMRLDFVEYVVVKKHRIYFNFDNTTQVMIDTVDGAGYFVEIETNLADYESAVGKNLQVLATLGLGEKSVVNIPYRDLVAARHALSDGGGPA